MDDNFSLGYAMGQNSGGGWGMNGWGDWILIILLFAVLGGGYGGFGFGGFGGGAGLQGVATRADINAGFQFQDLQNGIRGLTNGLSDSTFALNNTIQNGFHGVDNAICTLGYQTQTGFSGLSAQLAQCCCDTRAAIQGVNTGIERTGWNISKQISDCCCDLEKMNMQNRFDAQGYNCNTLQAIDKLGDRIIDYMASEKTQALRDENQALRLAASQAKQNQYLVDQLRPCPIPAYITCNPFAASYGFGLNNGGCGCCA